MAPRFLSYTPLIFLALSAAANLGCGDDGGSASTDAAPPDAATPDAMPETAPPLFNAKIELTDNEVATQALDLLQQNAGPSSRGCDNCHGITRQKLYYWRAKSDEALQNCFTDLEVSSTDSARSMVDCLRVDSDNPDSKFDTATAAIFSAAGHLDWFKYTFQKAYGDDAPEKLAAFNDFVGMPKGANAAYSQDEFDIIATWFARGLPLIEEKLPTDPRPDDCEPGVSGDVVSLLNASADNNWKTVNEANSLLSFGCAGVENSLDCLASYPASGDAAFSQGWPIGVDGHEIRVLRTNNYASSFWTRSSVDGRFVAHGGGLMGPSTIVDLQNDVEIPTSASYDPAFFPDNSGFMFQSNQAHLCNQSLLLSEPDFIDYNEAACSSNQAIGLYQHIGANLDGSDYWAIAGQFVSDNGGMSRTVRDPGANFSSGVDLEITKVLHDGQNYQPGLSYDVPTPYEGDSVLSPSSRFVISRLAGDNDRQLGFVMRELKVENAGTIDEEVSLPEVARYCINGGKPGFSYDEEWMVLHHYQGQTGSDQHAQELGFVDASDPGYLPYQNLGTANIYLIHTRSGETRRITHMQPGQYALFPHFRSDGWIYFMVRNGADPTEYIAASDAVLRIEAE